MKKLKTLIEKQRSQNLLNYVKSNFKSLRKFAIQIGKTYSHVHAMLYDEHKSFGDKVAREIELKLNLEQYSLDKSNNALNHALINVYSPFLGDKRDISFNNKIDEILLPLSMIRKNDLKEENLIAIEVHGDSMSTTISDNGIVIIDTSKTEIVGNKIYAFIVDKEIKIKRLIKGINGIIIRADNYISYPDEKIPYTDDLPFKILGQVAIIMSLS